MATVPKKKLSVLKRVRQTAKRNLRNKSVRTKVRNYIKKLYVAIKAGEAKEVDTILRETIGVISSAASKGVYHKNTASRYISRLTKRADKVTKAA